MSYLILNMFLSSLHNPLSFYKIVSKMSAVLQKEGNILKSIYLCQLFSSSDCFVKILLWKLKLNKLSNFSLKMKLFRKRRTQQINLKELTRICIEINIQVDRSLCVLQYSILSYSLSWNFIWDNSLVPTLKF